MTMDTEVTTAASLLCIAFAYYNYVYINEKKVMRNMRVWSQYMFSHVLTFSRSFVSRKKPTKYGEQFENNKRTWEEYENRIHILVSRKFLSFSRDSRESVERPLEIKRWTTNNV